MPYFYTLNLVLSVGGLFLAAVTIALFVDYFVFKGKYFAKLVNQFAYPGLILVTVGSVVISLIYSEYYKFVPCSLCWVQRIFIYPQALMSVIAFRTKDNAHYPLYGLWLSALGFLVSVYQYAQQMLPKEIVESGLTLCLTDGSGADCAVRVIDMFGFVTFPFLTAVTFAFLIVIYLYMLKNRSNG